ncbi:MAG: sensor histidine kinase [Methylococcaceae bacterium]
MPENSKETLFPCPLSKGYGIPNKQAWLLLKVFLAYRFILASIFIVLLYKRFEPALLVAYNNELFIYSSQSYLILTIISGVAIFLRLTGYTPQAQLLIFTDIIIITLLMHACGGIKSGVGILLAITIASSGLLVGGLCAIAFAALATLSILAEQIFSDYLLGPGSDSISYTYAGMSGAAFFTIAMLSYVLAKRSEETFLLANEQKQTIVKLEELNQYIIQHLQSGIVITNKNEAVQMVNEATLRLAHLAEPPVKLLDISKHLSLAFQDWLAASAQDFVMLQFPDQPEIYSRFTRLATNHESLYMIILEDYAFYNQRLQQSKLASLGQLTASIAHEIRNPLAAISHAGQLLSENPDLSTQDLRLTEIIRSHSQRVNHIIEDILQLSRRTDSRREKIYLKNWLDSYLENFILEHSRHPDAFKLILEIPELTCVFIDPGHLKQIMDNLCQNALRYGKPELGPIILHISNFQYSPCIEVIDNGQGINPQQLKHLFEPFFTTSASGTGLGLYISKELAELNQAELSYHLTHDKRSCFRLCLLDAEKNLIEI